MGDKVLQESPGKNSPLAKFQYVTLVCDENLNIQTHNVILVGVSHVAGSFQRKHQHPHLLVDVRRVDHHPNESGSSKEDWRWPGRMSISCSVVMSSSSFYHSASV